VPLCFKTKRADVGNTEPQRTRRAGGNDTDQHEFATGDPVTNKKDPAPFGPISERLCGSVPLCFKNQRADIGNTEPQRTRRAGGKDTDQPEFATGDRVTNKKDPAPLGLISERLCVSVPLCFKFPIGAKKYTEPQNSSRDKSQGQTLSLCAPCCALENVIR
jgi:hypothetical protein